MKIGKWQIHFFKWCFCFHHYSLILRSLLFALQKIYLSPTGLFSSLGAITGWIITKIQFQINLFLLTLGLLWSSVRYSKKFFILEHSPALLGFSELNFYNNFVLLVILFRWRNWWIRGMFTLVMFVGFAVIIYFGPFALILLVSLLTKVRLSYWERLKTTSPRISQ